MWVQNNPVCLLHSYSKNFPLDSIRAITGLLKMGTGRFIYDKAICHQQLHAISAVSATTHFHLNSSSIIPPNIPVLLLNRPPWQHHPT